MKEKKNSRVEIKELEQIHPFRKVYIFINTQAENKSWWWSYHKDGDSRRSHKSLKVPIAKKNVAIQKAKGMYLEMVSGATSMMESTYDLLSEVRHIGTYQTKDPALPEWLKRNPYGDSGGYVYSVFPSSYQQQEEEINQLPVVLDSLISGEGHFQKENIVRGKIGCSGNGKCSAVSLKGRIQTYIRAANGTSVHALEEHAFMGAKLFDNENWYAF